MVIIFNSTQKFIVISLYDISLLILYDDGGSSSSVFVLKVLVAVVQQLGDALLLVLLAIELGFIPVVVAAVVASDVIGVGVIFTEVLESLVCC